jgi:hypothetical protein
MVDPAGSQAGEEPREVSPAIRRDAFFGVRNPLRIYSCDGGVPSPPGTVSSFRTAPWLATILSIQKRIPARARYRGVPDKEFEQEMLRPYLGADYPYRRKQGFLLPFEEWMQDPSYQDRVMDVLADEELVRKAGLAPEVVRGVTRSCRRPRSGMPWSRVWSLFVLVSWCRQNGVCVV